MSLPQYKFRDSERNPPPPFPTRPIWWNECQELRRSDQNREMSLSLGYVYTCSRHLAFRARSGKSWHCRGTIALALQFLQVLSEGLSIRAETPLMDRIDPVAEPLNVCSTV